MRDLVLGRVAAALAGVPVPALPPAAPSPAVTGDLRARFVAEATAVGTVVHAPPTRADVVTLVADLLRPHASPRLVAWSSDDARDLARQVGGRVPAATITILDADAPVEAVAEADVGVTEVDALVAASGTLVLAARGHRHRAASLLPPVHVALVRPHQILPDLATALLRLAARPEMRGACLTLVTGPSRTADIEKKLVVGVHGPCALHVVFLP